MNDALNPLTFPLTGTRLIEASAGTGKTFTLALLYVRLVLGHGDDNSAFPRPLTPPQILVVTFTDAATKALRDRIRALLVAAAQCFEADIQIPNPSFSKGGSDASESLLALRETYAPNEWAECAQRLRLAAQWMDEAMISTIHAWCYRMLQEHAFDTRGLFTRELVTDQTELLAEVVRDYWRVHFYPLEPAQAALMLGVVKSPEELQKKLKVLLARREIPLAHQGQLLVVDSLADVLAQTAQLQQVEQQARNLWQADQANLEQQLRGLREHFNGNVHGSANADKFEELLAEIADWAAGAAAPNKLLSFAQGAFRFRKSAKIQTEIVHPAFQALANLQQYQAQPQLPFAAQVLAHAKQWVAKTLDERQQLRAEMGFDDLLRELEAALARSAADAPNGASSRLAAIIRAQFPVALIDEFQDTDPLQYLIFNHIYGVAANNPNTALILIGDPKQAIYGFRGADIHTYLTARAATTGRHHRLGVNYRSTSAVIDACQRLFAPAETGSSRGAFRCKTDDGHNPIPLQTVIASERVHPRLILDGVDAVALTFWTLDGVDEQPVSPGVYREQMAAATATQLVTWFAQAAEGKAGFIDGEVFQPLRGQDIAILVHTGTEAQIMREALAARRIHSVYLSDRESVFQTEEAKDLLHWLRAVAAPTDDRLVCAALGTNTLALPLEHLAQLQQDELAWEAQIERFRGYQLLWQQQGVLTMLRQLLHDFALPAQLLQQPNGERILTNLLHLSEWLQQSATALDGEQALIWHLTAHLDSSGDEFIQRLESDAELVKVITIHKAKGLEYPLVLLPFICHWKEVDDKTRQVLYRNGTQTFLEVAGKKQFAAAWEAADEARLSEDVRLIYVAVTRARNALMLGVAPLKSGNVKIPQLEKSAFGYLLNGGNKFASAAEVWTALAELQGDCPHLRIQPAPAPTATWFTPPPTAQLEAARVANFSLPSRWWIASYSALKTITAAEPETPLQNRVLEEAELERLSIAPQESFASKLRQLHDFPRGTRSGTFLHGILEWAAECETRDADGQLLFGFAAAAASAPARLEMLTNRCALNGLSEWIVPLEQWLGAFLNQTWSLEIPPCPPFSKGEKSPPAPLLQRGEKEKPPFEKGGLGGFALRDLAPNAIQVEMEFWIESHGVKTTTLDQLVQKHCQPSQPRPPLASNQLNGMLKGFIDLLLVHEGRYYVVDWKSNWLGKDDAAYTRMAMQVEMLHHRYDLQAVLYVLALHRLLKARLPNYDYDRDIGGAIYVFLRGAATASQGLLMDKPPRQLIEEIDELFAGAARQSANEINPR
ncbi:exodeoxyribonuclease V subunit beta [Chromatium okenii]|uniref:exodeoxyribonuclease V subunit beta n=1 Tax=Chromatium okenii TaxID=61644 RepID=UPI0026F1FB5E|nr:exodeoxyribonuclease V subunit beta [Chromatium okenii]MBV5308161.1 exodeoxyribonuclease V subunit beta [Chromatium okenii]